MSKFKRLLLAIERLILWLLFVACCANVLAGVTLGLEIGDVSRGKVVDGHFYLKHLDTFIEVSKQTYDFAWWHMISMFVTGFMAMAIWQTLWPRPN